MHADPMGAYSQRVQRNAESCSQIPARLDSGLFVLLIVLHDKLGALRGQSPQTALETFPAGVGLIRRRGGRAWHSASNFLLLLAGTQAFQKNEARDSAAISGKLPNLLPRLKVPRGSVDRVVRQIFGKAAPTPLEEFHQPAPQGFILCPGLLPIAIELRHQQVERVLRQGPSAFW